MKRKKPKQLYIRMLCTYTAIILCIVAALVIYFVSDAKRRLLEFNREGIVRIHTQALGYMEEIRQTADFIHKDLYRSPSELNDLLEYFRLEPAAYQEYMLERYSDSNELVYKGIFRFVNETFEANRRLEKMELISYDTSRLTECYPEKTVYPGRDGKQRLQQIQDGDIGADGKVLYLKEIRNPDTMKPAGCMIFTFEAADALREIQSASPLARMLVTDGEGRVIFEEPGGEHLESPAGQKRYFSCADSSGEYQITTFMDERQAAKLPATRLLLILAAGTFAGAAGIFYSNYYVRRFTGRVELILGAMNRVTTGDFKVRLNIRDKEDELDMIGDHFNGMCEKLELYIEKSYMAEIERKDAQMQALQSQINPHFLYNTLEAIRMKAIMNGDKEVGKMLYSMVVLFRSQLKEADVITLGQELDYCKQYLELFEYRYQGCFSFKVECPVELLALPVNKFVLQPVVENYFIHGIERDRQDNLVQIRAERRENTLYLYVEDNGRGMDEEALAKKNRELEENVKDKKSGGSIGIHNVNRRIKAACGEEYGICLKAARPKGLLVILAVRIGEEKEYEKGDAG
ncbi:MAG: sensor histidine kinase [Lachnospiraceae bacterium]|nr:sensor histidine kinase [Lachnospiraceae bacterium]